MALMTDRQRALALGISRLVSGNPFLPERVDAEREILGSEFIDAGDV